MEISKIWYSRIHKYSYTIFLLYAILEHLVSRFANEDGKKISTNTLSAQIRYYVCPVDDLFKIHGKLLFIARTTLSRASLHQA